MAGVNQEERTSVHRRVQRIPRKIIQTGLNGSEAGATATESDKKEAQIGNNSAQMERGGERQSDKEREREAGARKCQSMQGRHEP